MCESWKARHGHKGVLLAHPPVPLPRKLSLQAHPLRIPAGQPVLCDPSPFPAREHRSGGRPLGVLHYKDFLENFLSRQAAPEYT